MTPRRGTKIHTSRIRSITHHSHNHKNTIHTNTTPNNPKSNYSHSISTNSVSPRNKNHKIIEHANLTINKKNCVSPRNKNIDPTKIHDIFHYPSSCITPSLLSMESINTTNTSLSQRGMKRISLEFIHPWSHIVHAIGDTGANINAISLHTAHKLYQYHIKTDRRSFRVRTGGGYISCQDYVKFTILSDGVYLKDIKFYIIPDLPFNYLIGRPILDQLGYDLTKVNPTTPLEYRHRREDLDALPDEDIVSNPYPIQPKSKTLSSTTTPDNNNHALDLKIADRNASLTDYIKTQLHNHSQICAQNEFDIGQIPESEFKIEFRENVDTTPIRCAEYPHNVKDVAEIERQLRLMIEMGFISRSDSPWRFPTFIVPKKNGEARIVFDYRKLNAITKRLAYSLPSIQQLMAKFKGKNWISTIDIKSGYWHIPIRQQDRCKTAFIFNGKVYEWNVMPFGPTNSPPHFQKVMDKIFDDLDFVMVYMDDITVISTTPEQHQQHLKEVFSRLGQYKIKIRPDKCAFAQERVEYLGFIVDGSGVSINPKYRDKIMNIPEPKSIPQIRRFVGMVQFLHQFIPNLQQQLSIFHQMLGKNQKFKWDPQHIRAFNYIKQTILNANMIYHPDPNRSFEVYCDASIEGIGAVLLQRDHHGKLHPVSFCSKLFNATQRNWHVSEQEIYAVIHAVEKWRQYLASNHFTVYTDHLNLQELFNRARNFRAGKLYRWAVRLQEFDFTAKYIKGSKNKMADYMSRDALKQLHTTPTYSEPLPSTKPVPILNLYLHHLASSTNDVYSFSSDQILYAMNPDEVIGTSDDEDDDLPSQMPSPNASPSPSPPPTTHAARSVPDASNPNPLPSITRPKIHQNNFRFSEKRKIPNPIFHRPSHSYNTRLAKKQRNDAQFQHNLHKSLITTPDPTTTLPYNDQSPINALPSINHATYKTNESIISNKYSYPSFNQQLLTPTTPNSHTIRDEYDIQSYVHSIPISHIQWQQCNDPTLYPIIQYLQHHNNYYLTDLPSYQFQYVLSGRYYINHQNILMYRYGNTNAIVIPSTLKRSVLKWAHDQVHHGGSKMLLRITQQARYWWIGLRKDIRAYLAVCIGCQKTKGRNTVTTQKNPIRHFSKNIPFELLSIDICGPLPQTKSGNRYIVSMIDKFTRFCLLIPIADIKTITIIKAFQQWINLFGSPQNLLSDNGTQFTSELFKAYNSTYNIKQRFSTPYYPECNGQVERLHRWIKERLVLISIDAGLNFIDGDDNWDDYIGIIQHSYNSTPNTMTKMSPNKIIFGYDLQHNINPTMQNITTNTKSTSEYLRYMQNIHHIINNEAISNQNKYDNIRIKSRNKSNKESIQYEVGDLVLINISRRMIGNKSKLNPSWHGPHEIIEIIYPQKVFKIREIGNISHIQQININLMKPYKASPYIMMINYFEDNEHIPSDKITKYINHKRLTLSLLK